MGKNAKRTQDAESAHTANLDDALKTMLRIDQAPAATSNATVRPATQQKTPAPSAAEAEQPQAFDLMAILQKASNGVPCFEQFPKPETLPQPPATWHQKAIEAQKQEEHALVQQQPQLPQHQHQQPLLHEQQSQQPPQEHPIAQDEPPMQQQPLQLPQQQAPPPSLPQPFFLPGQPPIAMFPPNFVPMPLPPLNYGFPPNFYPAMMPPPIPMLPPGPFHGHPPNLAQFAQFHVPPHAASMAANPMANPNCDNTRNSAPVNAFIPLQAARKIAKDKASTKVASNSNDKPIESTEVRRFSHNFRWIEPNLSHFFRFSEGVIDRSKW